jgi:beta-galactosidase
MFKTRMLLCLWIAAGLKVAAQDTGRNIISLNDQWEFHQQDGPVEKVNIPHTWNDKDVLDDEPGYYRGLGIYRRKLKLDDVARGKDVYLVFNGVAQEAEILINGKTAGTHIGSYTGFTVHISPYLNYKNDVIEVRANNRFNEDIPPLTADFTFFGGLYRKVALLITDQVHFSQQMNGSTGVLVSTPAVSSAEASVRISSKVDNTSSSARKIRVSSTISNARGERIAVQTQTLTLAGYSGSSVVQNFRSVKRPALWSPQHPYLYRVVTTITDARTEEVIDQVLNPLAFRFFHFDADKGFFLNGSPLKLIGASRHQDYEYLGNAVPDALQTRDVELLKAMGGNFLRVAHYPQDPLVLEACDRLGILASVEIPVVNTITETAAFTKNCLQMQREMISQNYNHPSVIIWAYMNEILLRPKFANDKPRQQVYITHVRELAQQLDSLTRKEDPSRYTLLVNHGAWDLYHKAGLTKIPMLVGWNLYSGWYSGALTDFAGFLDRHHRELPGTPLLVTEYGADADPRIRSFSPIRFDKSVEYAIKFHQVYLKAMLERPFVAGGMAWNLADFSSETREETMPHINNKGLLSIGRKPKDTYHLYQAYLIEQPYLKFASSLWNYRAGVSDSGSVVSTQPLQVATNRKAAELFLNGKSLGVKTTLDHILEWQVPFRDGLNQLRVVAEGLSDEAEVEFDLHPYRFADLNILPADESAGTKSDFKAMNILLGSKRFYIEEHEKQLWMPGQAYRPGSWGYVGGSAYKGTNNRISYGSDKNILGTDNDPVYQTQEVGIKQFKLDVPDGVYDLTLHFAELIGGETKEALAYNLDNNHQKEAVAKRVFQVAINGNVFLQKLNLAADYGYTTAVKKSTRINVQNGKGIVIDFTAITGEPVLNAFQINKVY